MKRKHIIIAAINALIVLLSSYWIGNTSMSFGSEIPFCVKHSGLLQSEFKDKPHEADSFLFVNTCYDIDTVPHFSSGLQDGYLAITNRSDLLTFLRYLKQCDNYKYILLDIRIDKLPAGYNDVTDTLVTLLTSMPRVVIAQSSSFELADEQLRKIAGGVDYYINEVENGFVKFPIMQKNEIPSLPMVVYQNITKRKLSSHLGGLFYSDGYRLCRRTFIPTMIIPSQDIASPSIQDHRMQWSYVNLDEMATCFIRNLYADKIIVIGDMFLHDIHDTHNGKISGPVINANIFLNLIQNKHIVSIWYLIGAFLLYFGLFLLIIYTNEEDLRSPKLQSFWHSEIMHVIFSFIESGVIISLFALLVYYINGSIMNVMMPVLWFTIVPKIYVAIIKSQQKYE